MSDSNRTVSRVLLLGSTGSIGTQALDVIAAHPGRFRVVGLAAGGADIDAVAAQVRATGAPVVAIADSGAAARLREQLSGMNLRGSVEVLDGPGAATQLVEITPADVVLNALVGALGLEPTLAALASGARLAVSYTHLTLPTNREV